MTATTMSSAPQLPGRLQTSTPHILSEPDGERLHVPDTFAPPARDQTSDAAGPYGTRVRPLVVHEDDVVGTDGRSSNPKTRATGGLAIRGGRRGDWPHAESDLGSIRIVWLEPGEQQPVHWHPEASELHFVMLGRVRWTFVGPDAAVTTFEGGTGELVCAPPHVFHSFRNEHEDQAAAVLVAFSNPPRRLDEEALAGRLGTIPADVIAIAFGRDPNTLELLPTASGRVIVNDLMEH